MQAPLSSSQKSEVLRRQAFECANCQTDLEPVGKAPPHFELITPSASKGASSTSNFEALCPTCHAMRSGSGVAKSSEDSKRRQRESGPARSTKKFVKSGFDTRKF